MTTSQVIPQALAPAYNPIIYTFSSDTNTITGFRYLVDVYSGATTANLIARLKVTPSQFGDGYVDISKIVQNFVSESATFTAGTDSDVTEAYFKYSVRLGEEYLATWPYNLAYSAGSSSSFSGYTVLSGSTGATYIAGDQINLITSTVGMANLLNGLHGVLSASSNQIVLDLKYPRTGATNPTTINVSGITQYADSRKVAFSGQTVITGTTVFNGALDWPDWKVWGSANYTLNFAASSTTKLLLTSLEREVLVTDNTRRFYMTPSQNIWLNFYTTANTSAYTVVFELKNKNGTTANAGFFDITTLNGGDIKQFKIGFTTLAIVPLEGQYVSFYVRQTGGSQLQLTARYTIYADTICRREDIQLYYQDRFGSILSQSFTLNSQQKIDVDRTMIKKAILYGTNASLDLSDSSTVITNIELQRNYELATNWLTDAQIELIEELITSKYVWMLIGGNYLPVVVQDKGYEITYQRNKRLQRKNVTVQIANLQPLN